MKEHPSKYAYENFTCEIKIFQNENEYIVKFYDKTKDVPSENMINCVFADQGYGYISLITKNDSSGLVSGFLDESVFNNEDMIENAVDFVTGMFWDENGFYPYHIELVKIGQNYSEYNNAY